MNATRIGLSALAISAMIASSAAAQSTTYAIRGGKIYTLRGDPIESGTVIIRDGRIAAVGAQVRVPADAQVIDATGLQVYPGLFDADTRLGLTEIGQVDVTNDMRELGDFNPHLVAATAVHPASEHIPVTRANGITHAVAAPTGSNGGLAGQASLIHLDGWTIEEMLIAPSVAMVLTWPTIQTRSFDFSTFSVREQSYREAKDRYDERIQQLHEWLEAGRHYARASQAGQPEHQDLKLAAMARVASGELPVLVGVDAERDIRNAVAFADSEHIRIIVAGGEQAWKVADLLAEKNIPVILGPTQTLPSGDDEAYDEPYAAPGKLFRAGVKFGFATFNSSSSRTLPYEAAMSVGFGLPWEEALKAVTINSAEILGVGDELGTIEEGKIANLIVTDGDPLAIQTKVVHLFIAGHPTDTDNRHEQWYRRWSSRPAPAHR